MQKAFINVSSILDDEVFVKLGWQQFRGSTREFQDLIASEFQELIGKILNADGSLKEECLGKLGYFKFAKDHYGDNMQKAFQNVSAVLDDETFTKLDWHYIRQL